MAQEAKQSPDDVPLPIPDINGNTPTSLPQAASYVEKAKSQPSGSTTPTTTPKISSKAATPVFASMRGGKTKIRGGKSPPTYRPLGHRMFPLFLTPKLYSHLHY